MIFGRNKGKDTTEAEADTTIERDDLGQTPESDETIDAPLAAGAEAEATDPTDDDSDLSFTDDEGDDLESQDLEADADADPDSDSDTDADPTELPEELDHLAERWVALDGQDWREDGPFDVEEVDLEADDVERLDFGSLVVTPFEDMQLQLQIDEATQQINAALVMHENSALEIAVFAAPAASSMIAEIRGDMIEMTLQQGGNPTLAEGPFGAEIRRVIPLQGPDGEQMFHVSRTWFAEGPRWLLRGVLMGEAGMYEGLDGPAEVLYEFFRNLVVRRDNSPKVPGDLIPMTMPPELMPVDGPLAATGEQPVSE